jgi:hypothetical protein
MTKNIAIIDTPLNIDIFREYGISNMSGLVDAYDPEGVHALHGSMIVSDFIESVRPVEVNIDYYSGLNSSGTTTAATLLDLLWQVSTIQYDILLLSLAFDDDKHSALFDEVLSAIEDNGTLIICSAFNDKPTIGTLAKSQHTVGVVHHPGITKGSYKYLPAPRRLYFTNCESLNVSLFGEQCQRSGTSFFVPKLAAKVIAAQELRTKLSS